MVCGYNAWLAGSSAVDSGMYFSVGKIFVIQNCNTIIVHSALNRLKG